ncbi:MAG: hypothetical protein R3B82_16985 [Sandaracinaceae bacterium]
MKRIRAWLDVERPERRIMALAALLSLPSVFLGLQADDFLLAVLVRRQPLGAFWFVPDAPTRSALLDSGDLGWTASPALMQSFPRPLASLSHWLDFTLLSGAPWLMHLETVALWVAIVGVATWILRRLVPDRFVASLAALLFAVDGNLSVTVGWIAGRNSLLAALFGLASFAFHLRARERSAWAVATWIAFALSLASSELGLSTLAWMVAYAWLLDPRGRRAGLLAVAPGLLGGVAYVVLRAALGYGARGTGYYYDLGDPAELATGVLTAVPTYVVSQLTVCYASLGVFSPSGVWAFAAASVVLAAILIPWLAPVLRERPSARFFGAAAVLSAVLLGESVPQDRIVFFVGLGTTGLLAWRFATPDGRRWGHVLAGLLVGVHVYFAALVFVPMSLAPAGAGMGGGAHALEAALPTEPQAEVVVLHAPNEVLLSWARATRGFEGRPAPDTVRALYAGGGALEVVATDARSITLRVQQGWLATPIERAQSDRADLHAGAQVTTRGMIAEVLDATSDGRPREVRFTFERPLTELTWLRFDGAEVVPWSPSAPARFDALAPL